MFERLYAASQTFRDNIRFLSRFRLESAFTQLMTDDERERHMADTIQDESAALATEETTVATLVKDVSDEMTKFQTAAAAGQDTTPFVTRIQAITTSLQALDQSALAAMPPIPVTLPPASPVSAGS